MLFCDLIFCLIKLEVLLLVYSNLRQVYHSFANLPKHGDPIVQCLVKGF